MILGVLALFFVAAGVIALFAFVYRSTRGRISGFDGQSPAASAHDPRCGQCGYIVRGIPSLQCPECGADLREVGIDVGRGHGRRPASAGAVWVLLVGLAAVWTAFLWGVGGWAHHEVERGLARTLSTTVAVSLTKPTSGAYLQLTIDGAGLRSVGGTSVVSGGTAGTSRLTFTLTGTNGPLGTFTADRDANTFSYTSSAGPAVAGNGPVTAAAVAAWVTACTGKAGPDVDAEAVEAVLVALAPPAQQSTVFAYGRSGGSSSGGWSSSSGDGPQSGAWTRTGLANFGGASGSYWVNPVNRTWHTTAFVVAGIVVWLAGVGWMVRRWGPPRRGA